MRAMGLQDFYRVIRCSEYISRLLQHVRRNWLVRKLKHRQLDRRATEGSLAGISKSKGLAWVVQWTQGRSFTTKGIRLQQ